MADVIIKAALKGGIIAKLSRTFKACQIMIMKAKLWQVKPAIITKISAKKIIKILASLIVCLWVLADLYLMSNKSFGPVFNYDTAFLDKKSFLQNKLAKNKLPNNAELESTYMQLAQISLCENDFGSAQKSIDNLDKMYFDGKDNSSKQNADFVIANIYRDFGRFDQAEKKYSQTLSELNTRLPEDKIGQAKTFNNIGTTYFLQAQSTLEKDESQKDYLAGIKYFQKALDLVGSADLNLKKTIQNNLNHCLSELKFLN